VREIDSYIKSFDYLCPLAVNGNCLLVRPQGLLDDFVREDVLTFTAGPVQRCVDFRAKALAALSDTEDRKQHDVDAVMALLEEMHNKAEVERQKLL
jgi:glycerol-3-phosphate O-acyltransferase